MFVSGGLKLSQCIEYHPQCITSTMEKLTCSSKTITEIDIDHTLLEVLVFGKPTNRNKPVRPPPELGVSVRRLLEQAPAGENKKATSSAVNVQTAFSIVTLQLSHNRIHSLVGVLQFTNVVRLSLLGNHIRRIEDCEPLSLLQNLRYLSLEHNPVTGVLNYKHHLLRITAWPQELTMQSCRLLKLDGKLVRPNDIEDAVRNLAGEMGFIPDVFKRVQFKHFVELLEKRATTNAEMKRLGLIERTYTNVLRVDHLVRLVQMGVGSFLQAHDVLNGAHASRVCVGQALRRARRKGKADQSTEEIVLHELSSLHSEESDINLLEEVSDILAAPRRHKSAMESSQLGSPEASRQTSSSSTGDSGSVTQPFLCSLLIRLDIKICLGLLRVSRIVGSRLTSEKLDTIYDVFFDAAAAHSELTTQDVNCTGKRSLLPSPIKAPRASAPTVHRDQKPPIAPRPPREVVVMVEESADSDSCPTPTSLSTVSSMTATRLHSADETPIDLPLEASEIVSGEDNSRNSTWIEEEVAERASTWHDTRLKKKALRGWVNAVRHQGDVRKAIWHAQAKLWKSSSEEAPCAARPMWTVSLAGILPKMPRTERKRYFFDLWQQRIVEERNIAYFRQFTCFRRWKKRTEEVCATRQLYTSTSSSVLSDTFTIWKEKTKMTAHMKKPAEEESKSSPKRLDYCLAAPQKKCILWSPIAGESSPSRSPPSLLNALNGLTEEKSSLCRSSYKQLSPPPVFAMSSCRLLNLRTSSVSGAVQFSRTSHSPEEKSPSSFIIRRALSPEAKRTPSAEVQHTDTNDSAPHHVNAYPDAEVEQLVEKAKFLRSEKRRLEDYLIGVDPREENTQLSAVLGGTDPQVPVTDSSPPNIAVDEEESYRSERDSLLQEIEKLKHFDEHGTGAITA